MREIESFQVNHLNLQRGIYVSRKDPVGRHTVTTFDLRLKIPNKEPVMQTSCIHAIEHIGATFLRNHPDWQSRIIYFGPMGCRTGFYLIIEGNLTSVKISPLIRELFQYISGFSGSVPGATPAACGNYHDMNLPMAKWEANKYLVEVLENLQPENLSYQP